MSETDGIPPGATEHSVSLIEPGPYIASVLSVMASAVILLTFFKREIKNNYWEKMTFWLILGDFIFFLPKAILGLPIPKSIGFCLISALLVEAGGNSAFFWAPVFAHALYLLAKHKSVIVIEKCWLYYFSFAVVLPIISGIAIIFADYIQYNSKDDKCVHYAYDGEVDWGYVIFAFLPTIIAVFPCILFYILAGCYLRQQLPEEKRIEIFVIGLFPAVLLICWMPILTASIVGYFDVFPPDGLMLAFQTLANLNGFFDALIYGGTFKSLRTLFVKSCFKKVAVIEPEEFGRDSRDLRLHTTELSVISRTLTEREI